VCFSVVLHSLAVGVAAVGVGAAVVVRWQWCSGATSSSRCGGGCYTHNSLHISIAHRLRSYNQN
jgi:hypothetical protein